MIESIIVAFILAFVFRAFVIEAFVIPTGSMASTLNGKHGTMICSNCGWEYAYGLTDPKLKRERRVAPDSASQCPNCGHRNRTSEFYDNHPEPSLESGDRILVLKWPFNCGGSLLGPRRWDVIVFKNPRDGHENFIKRLTGLPGEVLEIIDGDLYTVSADELTEQSLATLEKVCKIKHLLLLLKQHPHGLNKSDLWRSNPAKAGEIRARMRRWESESRQLLAELEQEQPALLAELDQKLRIATKTAAAQEALWSVVYDADYPFRNAVPGKTRWWRPLGPSQSRWHVDGRRFTFDGEGNGEDTIELAGPPIDDFSGYNVPDVRPLGAAQHYPVEDLRLRCVVSRQSGDGHVRFALTRRDQTFLATVHADGDVMLEVAQDARNAKPKLLARGQVAPLEPGRKFEVAFENVDFRAALRIDGHEVAAAEWFLGGPDSGADGVADDAVTVAEIRRALVPPRVHAPRISAKDVDIELTHLALHRDVYYLRQLDLKPFSGYKLGPWGTVNNPILLREGEYFVLGDNSAQSADSRLWREVGSHLLRRGEAYQLGTVPEDQLIGRAFFVYWPSGLRSNLIPIPAMRKVGLIPNVGNMRWIR